MPNHGEFESEHPGDCVARETFCIGMLKGVGRVHQQTAIDTCAKVGFAKLHDRKTALTAADPARATRSLPSSRSTTCASTAC